MKDRIYQIILFYLLFGVNAISFGGDQGSPLLDKSINLVALAGIPVIILLYFKYPISYKIIFWPILLGVFSLILESLYRYNLFIYSPFVIKRFFYCGLTLIAYYVASKAKPFTLHQAVRGIFLFYIINQLVLGKIFEYSFTSESRTTSAPEAFYLIIPLTFYLSLYITRHKVVDLLVALFTFVLIVLILHRSVISTSVFSVAIVLLLSSFGKIANSQIKVGRTFSVFFVLVILIVPFLGALPSNRTQAFIENIEGIISPTEDETGSWRVEQFQYYMGKFDERPFFGWRFEGYDRGEVMVHEDFPDKGTFIHSQYVDQLYNYGLFGLGINLFIIVSTLFAIYQRNKQLSVEQTTLFSFIISGLMFAISYQLPIHFWTFTGVGMCYALHQSPVRFSRIFPSKRKQRPLTPLDSSMPNLRPAYD